MGQQKKQGDGSKKNRPRSAGSRQAAIAWYWSMRHPVNMARRAFRLYKRELAFGHDKGEAREKGATCAASHGAEEA